MIEQILLDQDGVLADFHTACLTAHGRQDLIHGWPEGRWDMDGVMLMSPSEWWKPLDNYGFWRNVRPYPGARSFYNELRSRAPVTICTSPSESADCAKAKIEWLREHIDAKVKYMIGSQKWLMGKPQNLLVDDYDRNVDMFREAGGMAYLLPRVWNSNYPQANMADPYGWALNRIDAVLCG